MMLEHGPYRHYKGGTYTVLFMAERHTHNGDVDVVYVSHDHGGGFRTRPLKRDSRNEDSWLDEVVWPDGKKRSRFMPVRSLVHEGFAFT